MLNTYEWDHDFRHRIMALCLQSQWYARFGSAIIKPEYFDLEEEQHLVSFMIDFHTAYNRPPEEDEMAAEFIQFPVILDLITKVLNSLDNDLSYAEERALQFARDQSVKLAVLDIMEDIEHGKHSAIVDKLSNALLVGKDLSDSGIDLYTQTEKWADLEDLDKIPTGDRLLDRCMEGGLARGEYGVILGPTNVGKTQQLVNIGVGAAGPISKANVLHVTLEMGAAEIARRYAARIADYFIDRNISAAEYIEDFYDMANVRLFGNIRIKSWPTGSLSINELKNYIKTLISQGFTPDVLLLDYPELMSLEKVGEYRHNLSRTNQLVRGLGSPDMFNMAVWGVAQSNRGSWNQEIVDLDTVAEDFGIVRIADTVITMSQTPEEYTLNMLRLGGMKVRGAPKNWIVRCKVYPKAHAIIGIETLTLHELQQERKNRAESQTDDTKQKLKEYAERKKNGTK